MAQETTLPAEDTPEEAAAPEDEAAGISPFDPDWLLMLGFAIIVDIADVVITVLGILDLWTVTTAISWALDGAVFAIIGGWMLWRTRRLIEDKRTRREATAKKMGERVATMQKLGRGEELRAAEEGLKASEKALAQLAKRPAGRALLKAGAAVLGELIPFIGVIPFWTIGMFTILWEKGE